MTYPLVDALGGALAVITNGGSGAPALAYNGTTWQLAYTPGLTYNGTAAQISALHSAFDALSASVTPGAEVDAHGAALADLSNAGSGGHALTYSTSAHLTTYTSGITYNGTAAQIAALASTFNAWSVIITGYTPPVVAPTGSLSALALMGYRLRPRAPASLIVGGQSLMANWLGAASSPTYYAMRHPGRQWNINPATGAFGPMGVPMPGVDGSLDCFIPRLGDALVDDGVSNLVVGNIAIGGTTFAQHAAGGAYNPRIAQMAGSFVGHGIAPTCVIWGQGESDAGSGTSAATVQANVQSIVQSFRDSGVMCPIVFALEAFPASGANVRAGVTAAVAACPGCFIGPDLDALVSAGNRYDGIHPNYAGEMIMAEAWRATISPYVSAAP